MDGLVSVRVLVIICVFGCYLVHFLFVYRVWAAKGVVCVIINHCERHENKTTTATKTVDELKKLLLILTHNLTLFLNVLHTFWSTVA